MLTVAVCLLGIMFFAMLTIAWSGISTKGTDDVLENLKVKHVEIVNDNGDTVIELKNDQIFGPVVYLYDEEGLMTLELNANSSGYGGALRTYTDGVMRMEFGGMYGWGQGWNLHDRDGALKASLNTSSGVDQTVLKIYANDLDCDMTRVSLGVLGTGSPELAMYGEDGEELVYLP
jgi:hypothetical protein